MKYTGLYDPRFEKSNCGVGFVADISGRPSHDIVQKGIQVVVNLDHRGAVGCDPRTGDGAGILVQIPDKFFRKECASGRNTTAGGFELPPAGEYAVGMLFLPQIPEDRHYCEGLIEEVIEGKGLEVMGWRAVPVNSAVIGEFAKDVEPHIKQIFLRRPEGIDDLEFERQLFLIRKLIQREVWIQLPRANHYFYLASISAKTIIYKGMLISTQIKGYFPDLSDPDFISTIAMVHQRYSTNTFPTWDLAHPFRMLAHNGEINTLRGNVNWMSAREKVIKSDLFPDEELLAPICRPNGSDSALLDNAVEFLYLGGRPLPHVVMMLIPEAWENDEMMDPDRRAFYEFHAGIIEPWDGPAAVAFTDGRYIGATLDRNGLRPLRYSITKDNLVVMASESGVLEFPADSIVEKGRVQPGKMFLVDTEEKRIISDAEIKAQISTRRPYGEWITKNKVTLSELASAPPVQLPHRASLMQLQQSFGYTREETSVILTPMAATGAEPIGSMGTDTPLACLSDRPQLLFHYFKQMFAQVTNPAIDPIREEDIMSTTLFVGGEGSLLDEVPQQCHQIQLDQPILGNHQLEQIRHHSIQHFRTITLPIIFHVEEGGHRLRYALDELCQRASDAVKAGYSILILSDRAVDTFRANIPSLLAVAAVHQHLVREGTRTKVGILVESGEPREVMHFALLLGYGASAINPYLAFDTITDLAQNGLLPEELNVITASENYVKAIRKGLLKVMSKMGISTLFSYHGAQIFEALGISEDLMEEYFTGTPSALGGIGLDEIAQECRMRHERAFPKGNIDFNVLDPGGQYHWRIGGERHMVNPDTVSLLQKAVRTDSFDTWTEYVEEMDHRSERMLTLRSLLEFVPGDPVPIEEVEPASEIVKRFFSGAMSFGSISAEAHETLAIGMNRIGGKSNTGEGGEDPERFIPLPGGDSKKSAIKQVASGRFGVTTEYLVNAEELQIKISQGAKPGEGGQLPGHKVDAVIARVRHATPGVGLISPPPHHDIYSIEDLAQLIYDLHSVNPEARVGVKLVSETGIGTVAAGVSKAKADMILVSGYDGGTGASPISSLQHAGTPWEIGLSETHQVLVRNDLRGRVKIQVDGKIATGRDIAVAALLGAEEFGFATMPLVSLGCIMMRKCHLNTCPVGIATQDPELRKKFTGKPEHVVNFCFFIAEDLRRHMAALGFRTIDEMVGRVDRLRQKKTDHWKAKHLDFSRLLYRPKVPKSIATRCITVQDAGLESSLDQELIGLSRAALDQKHPVRATIPIRNVNRTVGGMLAGEVAKRYGHQGLPHDTISFKFEGTAGQSFGAWGVRGMTLELVGDSNDYFGKGLSGARLVVRPSTESTFVAEENIIIGNVALYGAIEGEVYIRGRAGERFAVRNSGADAVVEGVGDHGCEYMTGGRVVVLGSTGRNFAAGMSGGVAYVWDRIGEFSRYCNTGMVGLEPVGDADAEVLHALIEKHYRYTESSVAADVLEDWDNALGQFVKVMPHDYKRALKEKLEAEKERDPEAAYV